MASSALSCRLRLPDGFRQQDVLDFHRRDAQQVAERVEANRLHKGVVWDGRPACLGIRFQRRYAVVELALDGRQRKHDAAILERRVRHMLGLDQPVAAFEKRYRAHPQIGDLIARNAGLRVPQAASPFEAVTWAILGQLISLGAAISIRRKLILATDIRHSSGLWCYPDAPAIAALSEATLRKVGCSRTKARALKAVAAHSGGLLPLDATRTPLSAAELRSGLLAVHGIGPWTVDYTLLRGFAQLDGSLHGDVAVRRRLQRLLGREAAVTEAEARAWLAPFSPWRALVAAHLWAMPEQGVISP